MSNLGVTPKRVYNDSEREDYGWGLGQFQHTADGLYIFVKIGATTVVGTATFVDPITKITEATATGDLEVIPEVAHTFDSDVDAYAFMLVEGTDRTASTEGTTDADEFRTFTIAT